MVTGVDIKLEPVVGSLSGELFKFRLKHGTNFVFDINGYTVSPSEIISEAITYKYLSVTMHNLLSLVETGNGFNEVLLKLPVDKIRYILCYYE